VNERTRVLLIDDHEMARRGLRAMLSAADWIEVVGEGDSCETGLALVDELEPTMVLLDIRMPGLDGLACLERIKARHPRTAVVMVTLYDDHHYVLEAIRRGASGYLLKDASTAEVIQTLHNVADGQLAVEPRLLREALATRDETVTEVEAAHQRAEQYALTPRELDVLLLVADGLTNKEIGGRLKITEDTVKKHVQNIIWKMRAADRTQAAIMALKLGLLETRS
jgi:DNA-binding NarL/FixJ family response regulator